MHRACLELSTCTVSLSDPIINGGDMKCLESSHANGRCIRQEVQSPQGVVQGRTQMSKHTEQVISCSSCLIHANLHKQCKHQSHCIRPPQCRQGTYLILFYSELCSCLEGVTFLVLGATGSLFSFRSSQSKSSAFLRRLGLQMQMQAL